jgi:hypothetical protein
LIRRRAQFLSADRSSGATARYAAWDAVVRLDRLSETPAGRDPVSDT